ncbi:alpha/beta hydrolase [Halorubellus sp. JP-L1]|uniref:dienelactone hydrolase family protein n=1 Tax=Halorubellus sp. JP-L1 TaxID=2715753 RepID=UPI00140AA840|nr:dienelactone hydrolase family protein [Halorubellus sp. JP-L1]NHN41432.1 alpha/beta hydrolase [Halorubellus sp. JP-L1]
MTESDAVLVPGARDVRASLDATASGDDARADADATACVVACPPHPQMGGVRSDRRLTATSDALTDAGVDCLRFDYGDWDDGRGEREDARNALRWATDRYDAVGVYGYSFGGAIAILAAASVEVPVHACAVLAPASRLNEELDAAAAVDDLPCPLQVGYGERDETADSTPVVEAAERCQQRVIAYASDHHFVGQHQQAGRDAADFLGTHLGVGE